MNRYGELAMSHWRRWRPQAFNALPNPDQFFTHLGEEVEQAIQETELPTYPQTGDYLRSVGQIHAARKSAEETVLADLVFLPPEPETLEDPELDQPLLVTTGGMPTDRDHPLWEMMNDPDVTTAQFKAALTQWSDSLPPNAH